MSKRCLGCLKGSRGIVGLMALALTMGFSPSKALASGPDETALDAMTLSQMEVRADHALARDQCYLYTELLHGLTELAGRQIAAGQDDEAGSTMLRVDAVAAKVERSSDVNANRLKNVEQLLDHTSHRLADMVHAASEEQRTMMKETLRHLNAVHTSVLAMVFAR